MASNQPSKGCTFGDATSPKLVMTATPDSTEAGSSSDGLEAQAQEFLALQRQPKVVLVVDLVESVRLMQVDEEGTIRRWRDFVREANLHVLPRHAGRLVKSLGDGLMAEFDLARSAVAAAVDLHASMAKISDGLVAAQQMFLRAGAHSGQVLADEHDIYGTDVNLAARVATLAGPGETVVSATGRIQPVLATLNCGPDFRYSFKASAGVFQPSVFRGLVFSVWATAWISRSLQRDRSVPLGKYCRRSPFVFSFVPRCHGL